MRDPTRDPLPAPGTDRRALARAAGLAAATQGLAWVAEAWLPVPGRVLFLGHLAAAGSRVVLAHAWARAVRAGGLAGAAPLLVAVGTALEVAGRAVPRGPGEAPATPGGELWALAAGSLLLVGFSLLWARTRSRANLPAAAGAAPVPGLALGLAAVLADAGGAPAWAATLGGLCLPVAALGAAILAAACRGDGPPGREPLRSWRAPS